MSHRTPTNLLLLIRATAFCIIAIALIGAILLFPSSTTDDADRTLAITLAISMGIGGWMSALLLMGLAEIIDLLWCIEAAQPPSQPFMQEKE